MDNVNALCRSVMTAVAASGLVTEVNIERAVEVMRAEVKALVFGSEYADERAAIMAGTVSEQTVLASVAASCCTKLREA